MLKALKPLAMVALVAGPAGLARAATCIQNASPAVWYLLPTGSRVWVEVRVGPSLAALGPPRRVQVGHGLSVLTLKPGTTMTLEVILEGAPQAVAHFGLMDSELQNTAVIVSVWQGWLKGLPQELLVVSDTTSVQAASSLPGRSLDARTFRIDREGYGLPARLPSQASAFAASAGAPRHPDAGLSTQTLQAFHLRHAQYIRTRAAQLAGAQGEPSGPAGPGVAAASGGSLPGPGQLRTPLATVRPVRSLGGPQILGPSASTNPLPYLFTPPSTEQSMPGPGTRLEGPGKRSQGAMFNQAKDLEDSLPGAKRQKAGNPPHLALPPPAAAPSPLSPESLYVWNHTPESLFLTVLPAAVPFTFQMTAEARPVLVNPDDPKLIRVLEPMSLVRLTPTRQGPNFQATFSVTMPTAGGAQELHNFHWELQPSPAAAGSPRYLLRARDGAGKLKPLDAATAPCWEAANLFTVRPRPEGGLLPIPGQGPGGPAPGAHAAGLSPADRSFATLPPRHPGAPRTARNPVGTDLSPAPAPARPRGRIQTLGIINDGDRTWTLRAALPEARALMVRLSTSDGQDGPLSRLAPGRVHFLAIPAGGMLVITGTEPSPDMLLTFSLGRPAQQGQLTLDSFLWCVTPDPTGEPGAEGIIELARTSHPGEGVHVLPLPPDMSWDGKWILTLH